MAPAVVTLLAALMVSAHGHVDSAYVPHVQCSSDHQCPEGFFCYDESQYCTRCLECSSYKRKSSWRSCPKTPSDCGLCIQNHEEEFLHEGKTRDMCIPSPMNPLSHVNVPDYSYERYIWGAAVTALLLPIVFYAFCWKNHGRARGPVHHNLPNEEPPPYRSIELSTLSSTSNSEERLSEEAHVLRIGQQKDSLVQAVPFRQPDYGESELMAFDNTIQETNSDESSQEGRVVANVELHDDNTMPSDWTPAEEIQNNQLMSFEPVVVEATSDSEDTCEPASKRHKTSNSEDDDENCNPHLSINLVINNHVTIHKPT